MRRIFGLLALCSTGCSSEPARHVATQSDSYATEQTCISVASYKLCPTELREGAHALRITDTKLQTDFAFFGRELELPPSEITMRSQMPILDRLFRLALHDIGTQRVYDKDRYRFNAGQNWPQAWARDTSYSIDLGLGFLYAEETRNSLDASLEVDETGKRRVRQDSTLHFGGWPHLSDGIVWALGADEWHKVHGGDVTSDFAVIQNSLARAERDAFDRNDGLFKGVASFMESNSAYPQRYEFFWGIDNARIGDTKAFSTNVLYWNGYRVASAMAKTLRKAAEASDYENKASVLERAIERTFSAGSASWWGYFKDHEGTVDGRMEALGTLLAGRLNGKRWSSASSSAVMNVQPYGTPCLWPQYEEWIPKEIVWWDDWSHYHNGMVWPFIEAYRGWMASRNGDAVELAKSFAIMARLAADDLTFREYHHWKNGRAGGSRSQLWSASGYIGLVLRGLVGIETLSNALTFSPVIPESFGNELHVSGLHYRGATLDIDVHGTGMDVAGVFFDGEKLPTHSLEASRVQSGRRHRIEIEVTSRSRGAR